MVRSCLVVLCVISTVIGVLYALQVPRGLPGDEVSHFLTVQFMAEHGRMPVLGETDATYEAQFGPLYYALAAVVYRVAASMTDDVDAFFAVRIAGVGLFIPMILLAYRLAKLARPSSTTGALLTAAFVGLNPSLLGMGGTVQNDLLMIVLVLTAMHVLLSDASTSDVRRALFSGALIGFAVITKTTAVFLVAGLPIAMVLTQRRVQWRRLAAYLSGFTIVAGWWFVLNQLRYGSPSPIAALQHAGYDFPPDPLTTLDEWVRRGYTLFTTYWLPTESLGNAFSAPTILRLFAVATTLLATCGWITLIRRKKISTNALAVGFRLDIAVTYLAVYIASLAFYLFTFSMVIGIQARTMMVTYVVVAIALAFGLEALLRSRRQQRTALLALIVALLLANVIVLDRTRDVTMDDPVWRERAIDVRCLDPVTAVPAPPCFPTPR